MSKKEFYVYVHYRADSFEPFYVGKGTGNRYKDAVKRNQYWHNVVNKYGFVPQILQFFEDEENALSHEKGLIKSFRDMGFTLTNLTDGGEGVSGFKHSSEAKAIMSKARAGSGNVMYGKTHSAETKAKISESHTGKKRPPRSAEHQLNMSESMALLCGSGNPRFKGAIVATNVSTGEQLTLCGYREILAANFTASAVYACVLGKKKQYKGFTFVRNSATSVISTEGGSAC